MKKFALINRNFDLDKALELQSYYKENINKAEFKLLYALITSDIKLLKEIRGV